MAAGEVTEAESRDLSKRLRHLAMVLDATRAMASERDPDALLFQIIRTTTDALEADRSTLFLLDRERGELWSKVAQGDGLTEIRVPLGAGIAGHVAKTGRGVNLADAYGDPRFNREVDRRTGYRTRSLLCLPIRDREGHVAGVVQVLNKRRGLFTAEDEELLTALASQAVIALENATLLQARRQEAEKNQLLLEVMRSVSGQLELDSLLPAIMAQTSRAMQADRSTVFLIDGRRGECWSRVAQGTGVSEIRFPVGVGIAGQVAATGETLNIPDAYDDPRFNQEVDRRTGYRTRSILCMPMTDPDGRRIGVVQVLNKQSGVFTREDEQLLGALASQVVIALRNASLFEQVLNMKNYNESILRSMATGVIALDAEGALTTANPAARRILGLPEELVEGTPLVALLGDGNEALLATLEKARDSGEAQTEYDLPYTTPIGDGSLVNLSTVPLRDSKNQMIGLVLVIEDVTEKRRLMGTLSRVVSRQVAEQLLQSGELKLGGERKHVTVVMTDIRNFTPMSETYAAEDIVMMLNDYFSRMIEVIFRYEGTLDKFIGDAIMAVFGAPVAHHDDPERAVRAAIEMRQKLREFNEDRRKAGKWTIETGIGICNGEVVSGTIGSDERLEYTVIGDAVNLSARLENLTKQFGECKILMNEPVHDAIKDLIPTRLLGEEKVRGKRRAVKIYGVPESAIP
jgi:adenylate cyclase